MKFNRRTHFRPSISVFSLYHCKKGIARIYAITFRYRRYEVLQYTGTPCPHTVTGFCRCFAFRIGKIRGHNGIIRNFQFRKFLPMKSNYEVTVHLPSLSETVTIYKMRQRIFSLPHRSYFIFQAISLLSHDLFSSIHRSPDPHTSRRSPVSPLPP